MDQDREPFAIPHMNMDLVLYKLLYMVVILLTGLLEGHMDSVLPHKTPSCYPGLPSTLDLHAYAYATAT